MKLSIIVTNYKNSQLLKECLDSIKKYCRVENYEIIVSDSATEEDMKLMMRENFPEVIFFPFRKNTGFAKLVNKGLKTAKGEYLLVMNGDIIMLENSISKLLDYICHHPETGIVGPQLLNFNGTSQSSCFRFYKPMTIVYRRTFLGKMKFAQNHLAKFLMKDADLKSIKEVDWLMGSALMTSRAAVDKVGYLDTRYKMYLEDTDWCRRFWSNGYKVIYYPEAKMYHYHGKGSAGKNVVGSLLFNKLTWWHIASAVKYFRKYLGQPLPKHN